METKTFKESHFISLLQYSRFDSVIFFLLLPLNLKSPSSYTIFGPPPPPINFIHDQLFRVRFRQKISGASAGEGQTRAGKGAECRD